MMIHILGLFIQPKKEWQAIHDSECSVSRCYLSYVLILAAIPPVAGYLSATPGFVTRVCMMVAMAILRGYGFGSQFVD